MPELISKLRVLSLVMFRFGQIGFPEREFYMIKKRQLIAFNFYISLAFSLKSSELDGVQELIRDFHGKYPDKPAKGEPDRKRIRT